MTTTTRTLAAALAGLALAGAAAAAPAQATTAAPIRPVSTSGTLRPNQAAVIATSSPTVAVCLRLATAGSSARVLVAPRAGFPMTVIVRSTAQHCTTVRPQGSLTLRNYGPATVRFLVAGSGIVAG